MERAILEVVARADVIAVTVGRVLRMMAIMSASAWIAMGIVAGMFGRGRS